jgi:hypothetical protein
MRAIVICIVASLAACVVAQSGPPVSAACAAAFEKVLSAKKVTKAEQRIHKDNDELLNNLNSTCTDITKTHACATNLNWTGYYSDFSALDAAAKTIDPSAKTCFLDCNFTIPASPWRLPYDVSYAITQFRPQVMVGDCTTADQTKYLIWYAEQIERNETSWTKVTLAFTHTEYSTCVAP